jgi:hypothetical protein
MSFIKTSYTGDNLNLKKLVEEFPLDVSLNKERTLVKQGSVVVDKSLPICSKKAKNKVISKFNNGFINISYPENQDIMYFVNPPEIIPLDCYCIFCSKHGPYAHDNFCSNPKKSNLHITFFGFIRKIYTLRNKKNKNNDSTKHKLFNNEYISKLCTLLNEYSDFKYFDKNSKDLSKDLNKDFSKEIIEEFEIFIKTLQKTEPILYDNLFNDTFEMKILLADLLNLKKKDKGILINIS